MQIDQPRQDHTPGADRVLDIARLRRADRHDLTALHHHPAPAIDPSLFRTDPPKAVGSPGHSLAARGQAKQRRHSNGEIPRAASG